MPMKWPLCVEGQVSCFPHHHGSLISNQIFRFELPTELCIEQLLSLNMFAAALLNDQSRLNSSILATTLPITVKNSYALPLLSSLNSSAMRRDSTDNSDLILDTLNDSKYDYKAPNPSNSATAISYNFSNTLALRQSVLNSKKIQQITKFSIFKQNTASSLSKSLDSRNNNNNDSKSVSSSNKIRLLETLYNVKLQQQSTSKDSNSNINHKEKSVVDPGFEDSKEGYAVEQYEPAKLEEIMPELAKTVVKTSVPSNVAQLSLSNNNNSMVESEEMKELREMEAKLSALQQQQEFLISQHESDQQLQAVRIEKYSQYLHLKAQSNELLKKQQTEKKELDELVARLEAAELEAQIEELQLKKEAALLLVQKAKERFKQQQQLKQLEAEIKGINTPQAIQVAALHEFMQERMFSTEEEQKENWLEGEEKKPQNRRFSNSSAVSDISIGDNDRSMAIPTAATPPHIKLQLIARDEEPSLLRIDETIAAQSQRVGFPMQIALQQDAAQFSPYNSVQIIPSSTTTIIPHAAQPIPQQQRGVVFAPSAAPALFSHYQQRLLGEAQELQQLQLRRDRLAAANQEFRSKLLDKFSQIKEETEKLNKPMNVKPEVINSVNNSGNSKPVDDSALQNSLDSLQTAHSAALHRIKTNVNDETTRAVEQLQITQSNLLSAQATNYHEKVAELARQEISALKEVKNSENKSLLLQLQQKLAQSAAQHKESLLKSQLLLETAANDKLKVLQGNLQRELEEVQHQNSLEIERRRQEIALNKQQNEAKQALQQEKLTRELQIIELAEEEQAAAIRAEIEFKKKQREELNKAHEEAERKKLALKQQEIQLLEQELEAASARASAAQGAVEEGQRLEQEKQQLHSKLLQAQRIEKENQLKGLAHKPISRAQPIEGISAASITARPGVEEEENVLKNVPSPAIEPRNLSAAALIPSKTNSPAAVAAISNAQISIAAVSEPQNSVAPPAHSVKGIGSESKSPEADREQVLAELMGKSYSKAHVSLSASAVNSSNPITDSTDSIDDLLGDDADLFTWEDDEDELKKQERATQEREAIMKKLSNTPAASNPVPAVPDKNSSSFHYDSTEATANNAHSNDLSDDLELDLSYYD
jgi:hypothetical protein